MTPTPEQVPSKREIEAALRLLARYVNDVPEPEHRDRRRREIRDRLTAGAETEH